MMKNNLKEGVHALPLLHELVPDVNEVGLVGQGSACRHLRQSTDVVGLPRGGTRQELRGGRQGFLLTSNPAQGPQPPTLRNALPPEARWAAMGGAASAACPPLADPGRMLLVSRSLMRLAISRQEGHRLSPRRVSEGTPFYLTGLPRFPPHTPNNSAPLHLPTRGSTPKRNGGDLLTCLARQMYWIMSRGKKP